MIRFLVLIALVVACQVDQDQVTDTAAKTYDVEGEQWTRTTLDFPRASIDTEFVPYHSFWFLFWGNSTPLNECVAVNVDSRLADIHQQWVDDKVEDLINGETEFPKLQQRIKDSSDPRGEATSWLFETIKHVGFANKTKAYRRPAIIDNGAQVLCVSIYDRGDRRIERNLEGTSVNMFSFWDGQEAMRVGCGPKRATGGGIAEGAIACHNIDDELVFETDNFGSDSFLEKRGGRFNANITAEIRRSSFEQVSNGRVKIVAQSLSREHFAFFPYHAKEKGEYKFSSSGNTRNFDRVLSLKTHEDILLPCEEGFRKEFRCRELGVKYGACQPAKEADKERAICKLSGRGILINYGNNDVLRVANCEYNGGPGHFYCSDTDKVYFERYGVYTKKGAQAQEISETKQEEESEDPPSVPEAVPPEGGGYGAENVD